MRSLLLFAVSSLSLAMAGCGPSVVGRACDASDPCPTHFTCAVAFDHSTRCMRECALSGAMAETVCSDGTVCLPISTTSTTGACYLGGNVAIGGSCTSDLDCTRTGVCILSGSIAECRVGCNVDGTHGCSGGFLCQPTVGTAGFCAQTM